MLKWRETSFGIAVYYRKGIFMQVGYLIHGTSTRDDDWFPWLEASLKPRVNIERLWLPQPFDPDPLEWERAMEEQMNPVAGTLLVAHSLGCLATLRYIEQNPVKDLRLVLVGAFDQLLPAYPQLDAFCQPPLDYAQIKTKVSAATIITAQDDYVVPTNLSVQVAQRLAAKLIELPTGGHFLTSDGYQQFPLVKAECLKLID